MATARNAKKEYREELGLTKEHLLAFLDAVFSIAVTLPALEIRIDVPYSGTNAETAMGLISTIPSIISYVISFFVIASYWVYSHRMFHYIEKINRRFVALALVFLFFIAFVPFPTLVFGQHVGRLPAVAFYSLAISAS